MIKLFKAKSLKSNTKTGQGAGVGASLRGVGVSAGVQGASNKSAKKQKGRSMVEMLGVLAIIGVLSIGGIQGYTMAMRRYRANEILNIVQKYAMVLYSGCQQAIAQDPEHYGIVGENTHYLSYNLDASSENKNFWYCPGVLFTDAGLGSLPNGVLAIGGVPYRSDVLVNVGYYDPRMSIKSLSSGDAVVITVKFETQELCESVMSITGVPIGTGAGMKGIFDSTCGASGGNNYYLAITTMMN